VPGHLALIYHVALTPALTSYGPSLDVAITRSLFPFRLLPLSFSSSHSLLLLSYRNYIFLRYFDLAQHTNVGVEWIWHVVSGFFHFYSFHFERLTSTQHRLHPMNYVEDCNRAFGRLIPSQYPTLLFSPFFLFFLSFLPSFLSLPSANLVCLSILLNNYFHNLFLFSQISGFLLSHLSTLEFILKMH
jgi:hypothetical protein